MTVYELIRALTECDPNARIEIISEQPDADREFRIVPNQPTEWWSNVFRIYVEEV